MNEVAPRTLGNTGLAVSPLGIGTAEIGMLPVEQDHSERLLNALLDMGINFVDTAVCYGNSEETIGRAISHRRSDFVLLTKCGHKAEGIEYENYSPEIVTAGIDRSLKLMNTDHVDILLLHSCDADHLKRDDLIAALVGAKQAGKARFIGYSGDGEAAELAVGMEQFDCLETSVSICDQQCIEKYLGTALQRGMGVIAKRPIANACWRNLAEYDTFYSEYARAYTERLGVMDISPETLGFDGSWAELALRFTLSQPAVATAIVGTTRLDHVQENLDARRKGPLDASTMQAIVAEWKRCDDGSWVAKT